MLKSGRPESTALDVMNNDAFHVLEEEFVSITTALSRKISSIQQARKGVLCCFVCAPGLSVLVPVASDRNLWVVIVQSVLFTWVWPTDTLIANLQKMWRR